MTNCEDKKPFKKEYTQLVENQCDSQEQIEKDTILNNSVKYGSIRIRYIGDKYLNTPYCAICLCEMTKIRPGFPFRCVPCRNITHITSKKMREIISKLPPVSSLPTDDDDETNEIG